MVIIEQHGQNFMLAEKFSDLIQILSVNVRVLVDMPVGLLSEGQIFSGNRPCDVAARKLLGKKHSSIFSPPCMEAIHEKSYQQASAVNESIVGKKISKQSWNIVPKIREINAFLHLNPIWRKNILEAHPELAFQTLNQHIPLQFSKKKPDGLAERIHLLEAFHPGMATLLRQMQSDSTLKGKASADDIADAACLAVLNWQRGDRLRNISKEYPEDLLGNKMGIWS